MKTPFISKYACAAVFWLVAATAAFANNWTGNAQDSDWFNSENWNPAAVPGGTSAIIIGDHTVNYAGTDSSVSGFELDLGTLNITQGTISLTAAGDTILAGRTSGDTYLKISDGGFSATNAKTMLIGHAKGSNGYVTVGDGGTLTVKTTATTHNDGMLMVGNSGYGKLEVKGGTVKASNLRIGNTIGGEGLFEISSGSVNASRTIHVGNIGAKGTLNMTGGTITAWYLYFGSNVGSDGTTAKGYGYLKGGTINATLGVTIGGESGTGANYGEFNISGGSISTLSLHIGKNSQAEGVLNLSGGTFSASTVYGSYSANTSSTINLENGGTLRANSIYLGYAANSTSVLNINGTSGKIYQRSSDNYADIQGRNGTGVVRFNHGGTLSFENKTTGGNLKLEHLGGGTTTLRAANTHGGGTLVKSGILIAASETALGSGLLSIEGGAVKTDGANKIATGSVSISGGRLALADNAAFDTTLSGDFSISGGYYEMDILSISDFDRIVGNSGSVNLIGGTLVLNGYDGFEGVINSEGYRYKIFEGFNPITDVSTIITGYDDTNWTAEIDQDGYLYFTAVPEPSMIAAVLGAAALLFATRRKRAR